MSRQEAAAERARIRHESREVDADAASMLKVMLSENLAEDAATRKKRRKDHAEATGVPDRWCNRRWLQAVDQQLRSVRPHGIKAFIPRRRLQRLCRHEHLYLARVEDPDGTVRRRACLENKQTGVRQLCLVGDTTAEKAVEFPCWHVCVDFAPIGYPGLSFVKNCLGARMTVVPDRFHQILCAWDAGVSSARCLLKKLEFKPLNDLRFGPYGHQAHHGTLVKLAEEFFAKKFATSPLFEFCYAEHCQERVNVDGEVGTEHLFF